MRWKRKKELLLERQIKRFLILPKCIKGEWRLLEWATIKQQYGYWSKHWRDKEWVDEIKG